MGHILGEDMVGRADIMRHDAIGLTERLHCGRRVGGQKNRKKEAFQPIKPPQVGQRPPQMGEGKMRKHGEGDGGGAMFPTGNLVDELEVPGVGTLKATMINAGIPTVFVNAADTGYTGSELQDAINGDAKALATFEAIRAHGAVRMGLIKDVADAAKRQHTPKVAFVAPPADYTTSSGKRVAAADIDLHVRALSMGKLHHAMMGTCAVAIGTAAAIPGTLVNEAAGGGDRQAVRFGHPSGTLRVGAEATQVDGKWQVRKAIMSRSARVLMEGAVRVPADPVG